MIDQWSCGVVRMTCGALCAAWLCATPTAATAAASGIDLAALSAAPNPRLGLSFPGSQTRYYPYIAAAGLGVVRLSVSWGRVEPRAGTYEWAGLDERVRALQDAGIMPFLTFESDADWATLRETHAVKNAAPRDVGEWARFVAAVVERYDNDGVEDMPGLRAPVRYYQVGNEWESDTNRSGGWIGSGRDLVEYVNVAHDAAKGADPDVVIVLGGLAAFNLDVALVASGRADFPVRQKWSDTSETVLTRADMQGGRVREILDERVLPVLRDGRYDVADAHLYGPEDRDPARIALLRELTGRPVLSAECGGPSVDYGGSYTPEAHFLAVVHRNLGVLASGSAFCLWFRLGESEGATYGNRFTALYDGAARPKPGVFAYKMLSRIVDAKAAIRPLPGAATGFEIVRGAGDTVRVAWGTAAADVRDWAAETGAEAFCLADASAGRLDRINSAGPAPCDAAAFVVAGKQLSEIMAQ